MEYLPVFMNLRGRLALVVGGGDVAARKAELLLSAGARIRVVSPEIGAAMRRLIQAHEMQHIEAPFLSRHVDGASLVIAASSAKLTNRAVSVAANERNIPVNVVDQPALCSFILPAIVNRSPVVIALSTGGRSPVLARFLKARLESLIPAAFGRLAGLLGRYRESVREKFVTLTQRRRFWESVLDGGVTEMMLAGRERDAEEYLTRAIAAADREARTPGEVYLIGSGPGDPDLLTFRAQRLLQRADIVFYDRLVPEEVLGLCRREAELVYVGKRCNAHAVSQEDINRLLVQHARNGRRVARLKGGDPFVFGRGGEEMEALSRAGIPTHVVPGVSAANGCAAYAGIPLTHRDHACGVSFWAGHRRDEGPAIDWGMMAGERHTHVFYMALSVVGEICGQLITHGMSPHMPAAMVSNGTTSRQSVVKGTLCTLPGMVKEAKLRSPALLIVGHVVSLHRTHTSDTLGPEPVSLLDTGEFERLALRHGVH